MSCDPASLIATGACYRCIPPGLQSESQIDLLCEWANATGTAADRCGTPSDLITISTAGDAAVNQQYHQTANPNRWDSADGQFYIDTLSGYTIRDLDGHSLYTSDAENFPCVWFISTDLAPAPTGVYAQRVDEWVSNILLNGGAAPSAPTIAAVQTLLNGLRAAFIVNKMIAVNLFVPDNLIASITPIIPGPGFTLWTNNGFTGGMLSVDGLVAQTNTEYLDTGVNASTAFLNQNTAGYSIYSNSNNASFGFNGGMLGYSGGPDRLAGLWGLSGDHVGVAAFSNTWDLIPAQGAIPGGVGYFASGSRTSALDVAVYLANSNLGFTVLGTGTNPSVNPPNQTIGLNTRIGAPLFPNVANTYSFAAIHFGLTATETEALYNAVQAFRVSLGGGYS